MKKLYPILILLILTVAAFSGQAQKRNPGKLGVLHDTIKVSGSHTEFEIVTHNMIYNTSTSSQTYKWVILKDKELPANWDYAVCDINNCYSGVDSQTFTLSAGDSGSFEVHFYPGSTIGTGKLNIFIYPVGYYSDGITVYHQCNASTSGIGGMARFDFSMYPNPVRDILTIQFSKKGIHEIEVYNILGRRLMTKEVQNADRMRLSFANLQNGMYVIMYRTENGKVITKTISKE